MSPSPHLGRGRDPDIIPPMVTIEGGNHVKIAHELEGTVIAKKDELIAITDLPI